jgi:hypothetical protein
MSKKRARTTDKNDTAPPAQVSAESIPEYRRCPICWNGRGGYGLAYSTQGSTRYYKCKKSTKPEPGPCGHTWTATVRMEVIKIEHREVTIDGKR